ncbi:exodeoxyribonuclease I [Candidatus Saccharibacteria bacterium]|nr:exodeoxyribonuclease I [Candidatus Saccharibacteria bacterium]
MGRPTFFFYDLETSGLNTADDRIMQFAGQRADLNLNPVGEPVNILVKLPDDTLPSPSAVFTTKITPQKTVEEGITEKELAEFLDKEIFTPDTIILGFNSVRFDDKFIQHLLWRNFFDPYEWQWKEGRSRWDMLDVVRMTRALRPEDINWPVTEDGKPTNRLELITKLNGISHEAAHDALSDVNALIDVTRLIKSRQPRLYNYLFNLRNKREVKSLLNLRSPSPIVYTSGRYGSKHNFTTVVYPFAAGDKGSIAVFDLRQNLDKMLEKFSKEDPNFPENPKKPLITLFYPTVKEIAVNHCPAVAPLGVLNQADGWKKIDLSPEEIEKNLQSFKSHPEIIELLKKEIKTADFARETYDVESSLYDSFMPDIDKVRVTAVRTGDVASLAEFRPNFADKRLPELFLHYKAKNYPSLLSEEETQKWREYRASRLSRQAPNFLAELKKFQLQNEKSPKKEASFLLEELSLWYQSLQEIDY